MVVLRWAALWGCLLVVAAVFVAVAASPAWGQITTGTLVLNATFESISVTANFTAGTANSAALIEYRVVGASTFKRAYAPYIDRRATIQGVANPNNNQARGAVVGLVANTSYDIRVTWSDPGGVTGTNPRTGTITTLSHTPPTGSGTTRHINNNTDQTNALAAMNPGDTLVWDTALPYNAFTVSRSGNAGAWIILDGRNLATIQGVGVTQNVLIDANFIILRNFPIGPSDFHGIVVANGRHDIRIEGNTVQAFSRLCADGPNCNTGGAHCEDAGIKVGDFGSNDHVYVLNNSVTGHGNLAGCVQPTTFDGPGTGIQMFTCTTCVFADNVIVGNGARDGLSQDSQNNPLTNVDIARNTVSGYVDDGIEFKGSNLNVRAWGNIITENGTAGAGPNTCMSNEYTDSGPASNPYGPSYYFRNTCRVTKSAGLCGFKGPSGPAFFFHNSMDSHLVSGNENWAMNCGTSSVGSGPYWIYNNATLIGNLMFEGTPAGAVTTDYNCGLTTGSYASNWNNTTNYATFALFKAGTGQETNGVNVDPSFSDTALHLNASSLCKDRGLILDNFNTQDSVWGYTDAGPEAGAYEIGGFTSSSPTPLTPPPPTSHFSVASRGIFGLRYRYVEMLILLIILAEVANATLRR